MEEMLPPNLWQKVNRQPVKTIDCEGIPDAE